MELFNVHWKTKSGLIGHDGPMVKDVADKVATNKNINYSNMHHWVEPVKLNVQKEKDLK